MLIVLMVIALLTMAFSVNAGHVHATNHQLKKSLILLNLN
ncbi:MAG: Hypothetical protein AJITA_00069 [Acetilactobacillus jinshanensis]